MSSPPAHEPEKEWHIPQRIRVKTLKDDAGYSFRQIEAKTGIPRTTALNLYHNTAKRQNRLPKPTRSRGRLSKLSPKDIRTIEQILESDEFESRALT